LAGAISAPLLICLASKGATEYGMFADLGPGCVGASRSMGRRHYGPFAGSPAAVEMKEVNMVAATNAERARKGMDGEAAPL